MRGGNPEAYVRKVVVSLFLSWRRRRWSTEPPVAEPPDTGAMAQTAQVDDRDELRRALARLSSRQRVVVYLRYAEDLTSYAYAARKPSDELLKATLVIGAVSLEARTVEIKVGGRTFTTEAVGTPTSDKLRFFATVVPVKGATVTAVRPLDGDGKPTGRPDLPEESGPCVGEQAKTGDSGQASRASSSRWRRATRFRPAGSTIMRFTGCAVRRESGRKALRAGGHRVSPRSPPASRMVEPRSGLTPGGGDQA